ncbi:MAG TPA: hypothetical protein VIY09_02455 [Rhizomicrobium sp.]
MIKTTLLAAAAFALAGNQAWAAGPAALDQGLFATFQNYKTSIEFSVCGATGGSEGCYGSADLDPPFDYACGVLQGKPKTKGDTMTRAVYVLDRRTSTTADMVLYVYERKDVIQNSDDSVSATLKATVDLGITGGPGADCMLVGNDDYVYAGTNANASVATVDKRNNEVGHLAAHSTSDTLVSITADDRGYVAVNFTDEFYVVDPHGNDEEDGGGNAALINQRNGWIQN